MKWIQHPITATVLFGSWSAAAAQDLDTSRLDAWCKNAAMRPGFAAVGELNSPLCGTDPLAMNAWYIDKVRNHLAVCQLPDYRTAPPPSVGYRVCRRVIQPTCAPKIDGTANAYEMVSLDSPCLGEQYEPWGCSKGRPAGPDSVWPGTGGSTAWRHFAPDKSCGPDGYRGMVSKSQRPELPLPLCVDYNRFSLANLWYFLVNFMHVGGIVIERRFYSNDCPPVEGDDINAVLVSGFALTPGSTAQSFACAVTFPLFVFGFLEDRKWADDVKLEFKTYKYRAVLGPWVYTENGKTINEKRPDQEWTLQAHHDDRCGTKPGANAVSIYYRNL